MHDVERLQNVGVTFGIERGSSVRIIWMGDKEASSAGNGQWHKTWSIISCAAAGVVCEGGRFNRSLGVFIFCFTIMI